MTPNALAMGIGIVALQAGLLYLISRRLLHGLVVGTLAARSAGCFGPALVRIFRFPGNLLHELSHAAGYLLCGYSISELRTCLSDEEGRGYCQPGRPWSPVHWMPLAAAVAAVAPLFVGALALQLVAYAFHIDLPAADVAGEGIGAASTRVAADVTGFIAGMNWLSWQTYVFWYFALSIGAELAPSNIDLRQGGPLVLVLTGLLVLTVYAVPHMSLEPEVGQAFYDRLSQALSMLSAALFAGLIGCGVVGAVAGGIALLVGKPRRR